MRNLGTHLSARLLAATAMGLALNGCGGGSGGSSMMSAPVNRAPTITSSSTEAVAENNVSVAYKAIATDPDGDPVTFTLSGNDASRFTISATGDVQFNAKPNFERPNDSDTDNVYNIQVVASDGKTSVSQAVAITVTNDKEGIDVQRVATGLDHPVSIVRIPGQTQLMVAQRSGAIIIYDPATQSRLTFATIDGLSNADGQGIVSIAVQPNFATRHIVYVLLAQGGRLAVRQVFNNGGPTSYVEYDLGPRSASSNDLGGWLGFGADQLLYVATGDAGGTNDPTGSAQNSGSRYGKLLSFTTTSFDAFSGASVPAPISPILVAQGLHYPVGGTFYSGGLFLPDRGQSMREEVNALPLSPGTLDNLGWPFREGTLAIMAGEPTGLIAPVLEYVKGSGTYAGQEIVGGIVYQGANASLTGTYLFLDVSGAVFTAPVASLQRGATATSSVFERRDVDFTPSAGTITRPVALVQDATGTIYIACDNGDVFRVVAT